ncbi:hypothetical protein ACFC4S_23205 [Priestia megaterium]|uniref:hypothetical protein n=1 Tax=Priestia megaterium TaxID=1404 RepID=UPI0035D662FF
MLNIERLLIIMELTLQDVLQRNYFLSPSPSQFTEISIPVPPTPGISGLPARCYFDISTKFNAIQKQEIIYTLGATLFNWSFHCTQKWSGGSNTGVSQLASCTNIYATKNLKPTWYRGTPITNGRKATEVAMDQFTQMIKDNGFRRSPPARIFYSIPAPITTSYILGTTAFNQVNVPLSFVINPRELDNLSGTAFPLIGSMFHAWLHRAGFSDPKTTSYFISECTMCVMRGFQPKTSVPDSYFYRFFD